MNHKWNARIAVIAMTCMINVHHVKAQQDENQGPKRPDHKVKGHGLQLAKMDVNEDGLITEQEYLDAVAASAAERSDKLFTQYDINDDGAITAAEISDVHAAAIEERLMGILARWDADEDGNLSVEELEAVGRGRRGHRYVLGQFDGNGRWHCYIG